MFNIGIIVPPQAKITFYFKAAQNGNNYQLLYYFVPTIYEFTSDMPQGSGKDNPDISSITW